MENLVAVKMHKFVEWGASQILDRVLIAKSTREADDRIKLYNVDVHVTFVAFFFISQHVLLAFFMTKPNIK